jgi:hypothetical protein
MDRFLHWLAFYEFRLVNALRPLDSSSNAIRSALESLRREAAVLLPAWSIPVAMSPIHKPAADRLATRGIYETVLSPVSSRENRTGDVRCVYVKLSIYKSYSCYSTFAAFLFPYKIADGIHKLLVASNSVLLHLL